MIIPFAPTEPDYVENIHIARCVDLSYQKYHNHDHLPLPSTARPLDVTHIMGKDYISLTTSGSYDKTRTNEGHFLIKKAQTSTELNFVVNCVITLHA